MSNGCILYLRKATTDDYGGGGTLTRWQGGACPRSDPNRIVRDKMFRDERDGRGRTGISTAEDRSVHREEPEIVPTKGHRKYLQRVANAAALNLRSA